MRYSKCRVPGCSSLRQDVKLHRFPKDPIKLQHWLNSIGCDSLRGLSEEELTRLQVCHKHFEQRFVTAKSRIIGTGYPTLFSDEEITTGVPSSHVLNAGIIDPSREHSYFMKSHIDHNYSLVQPQPHAVPHVTSTLDVASTSFHFERDDTLISNIDTQENESDVASTSSHCERDDTLISNIETQVNELDVVTTSSHFERDDTLIPNIEIQVDESDCTQYVVTATSHFERDDTLSYIEIQLNELDVTTSPHFERDDTLISNIETQVNESVLPSQPRMQEKGRKKKLVQTVESLTPKCKVLYREHRKSKKLPNFNRRVRKALRFTKEHALDEEIAKLNPLARKVLCTKNAKGRHFSLDEKSIALSIMRQSPRANGFLQKIFKLLSKTT